MIPLTLAEIAALVDGTLTNAPEPHAQVTAPLMFDSRGANPGGLFLALTAERDGHDYARAAVEQAGATAALTTRPVGVPAIVVPDVLTAAAMLTAYLSAQLSGTTFIGVTGSSGKTSAKDLLSQILPALGPTVATEQSFNNEFGLPVTVSRATRDTKYLVLEMGARGVGHIRYLTGMAPLDTAIVLNVGSAHLGEFGSRQRIAEAKGELIEDLPLSGWAVLNADDDLVAAMAPRTRASVILFGRSHNAQVRAEDVRLDDAGRARFTLATPSGSVPVRLRLVGEHHVDNALAAAAAVMPYGMTPQATADALSQSVQIASGRMEVTERPDGVTVVNDAYNANPESMRAALDALVSMTCAAGRNPVAVLGTMLELGDHSEAAHSEVGAYAAKHGITVIAVGSGPEARWIAGSAASPHLVGDEHEAAELLRTLAVSGDVVLFKSSRDAGLRHLAARYATEGRAEQPSPRPTSIQPHNGGPS